MHRIERLYYISIHSLRMEGDIIKTEKSFAQVIISIHSLRMEGDRIKTAA